MIKKTEGQEDAVMRTCWECNPAHEGLKAVNFTMFCIDCGRYFGSGEFLPLYTPTLADIEAKVEEKDGWYLQQSCGDVFRLSFHVDGYEDMHLHFTTISPEHRRRAIAIMEVE